MSAARQHIVLASAFMLAMAAFFATAGDGVVIYGGASDGKPGWTISAQTPDGWSNDCCELARETVVNRLMYEPPWSGRPDRVFLLNVWPKHRQTIDVDWAADRASYFRRHP